MNAIRLACSPRFAFWSSAAVLAAVYVSGVLLVNPLFQPVHGPLVYAYSLSLPLMVYVLVAGALWLLRQAIPVRNVHWMTEMPAEFQDLAARMKIRRFIKRYGEHDSLFNAFADFWGRVVLGRNLTAALSPQQVLAVVAHEFAHLRQINRWTTALFGVYYAWSLTSVASLFTGRHPLLSVPPVLALNILLLCSVRWRMEFDADRNAANFVDPNDLADALETLEPNLAKRIVPSPMHPPISWRVARLRRLARERSGAPALQEIVLS